MENILDYDHLVWDHCIWNVDRALREVMDSISNIYRVNFIMKELRLILISFVEFNINVLSKKLKDPKFNVKYFLFWSGNTIKIY